jgi:hypothetical protein
MKELLQERTQCYERQGLAQEMLLWCKKTRAVKNFFIFKFLIFKLHDVKD